MKLSLFFSLVLTSYCFASSIISPPRRHHLERLALKVKAGPQEQWFTQKLDHFNAQESRTWKQRFYVNSTWFDKVAGGPLFFQIGGEGAIGPIYVTGLEMSNYAQEHGALQVSLEHRFYGKSQPLPDLSTPNLAYLSSMQALADAANFINHVKSQYPSITKTVIFGGSYPGALAAFARGKYPNVYDAAIATSAPIHAVLDMVTYLGVVDRSVAHYGGQACDANLRKAFAKVDSSLQTASGQKMLAQYFNVSANLSSQPYTSLIHNQVCTPLTSDWQDQANFLSNLIGNIMGTAQYNREIPNAPTLTELCTIMNNSSNTPFENLATLTRLYTDTQGCMGVSYADMIAQLKNTSASTTGVGDRSWTYQTCTQFGYFQTTDSTAQPFGTGIPLKFYEGICQDAFGGLVVNEAIINQTNVYYGSFHPGSDRILYVNGNIDPWSSLSIRHAISPSLLAIVIDGGAHCSNMSPWRPGMNINIKNAQTQISQQIQTWLAAGPL